MLNYLKSEFYRITHSSMLYIFTGILMLLSLSINLILAWVANMDGPSFPYGNTSFSYSNIISSPLVFYLMAFIIAELLYDSEYKLGTIKNSIAYGYSRITLFIGKIIATTIASTISMIAILGTYIISAELLLEKTGIYTVSDLFMELISVLLIAVAALISTLFFLEVFHKSILSIISWFSVWLIIPTVFLYLGLKFDFFKQVANWMPRNFFNSMGVYYDKKDLIWDTTSGLMKCIISGICGIVVFITSGIIFLRKRDI